MTAPVSQPKLPVTAAVLAGGMSTRMGADKVLLPVDGESLVGRVVRAAGEVCERVVVVTNNPSALEHAGLPDDVSVLKDEVAHQGPLGGLVTALAETENEWVLALAADLPWLKPEIVRALWDLRDAAQVVVPVGERGQEPLLALYHTDCLPIAKKVLASGRRRIVAIYRKVTVAEVPLEALRDADPELASIMNVNTPDDLLRVRESVPASEGFVRASVASGADGRGEGLPEEIPVTVHLNDIEIATMQASPCEIEELAAGFLLSEGIITDREAFRDVVSDERNGLVWVTSDENAPVDISDRKRYLTSGCGKGVTFASARHADVVEKVEDGPVVESEYLYELVGQLARGAEMYRETGGVHACALGGEYGIVVLREDVGRHNAVDKVLGRAWLDGISTKGAVLLTTGRISYEMTMKAAKAKVPIVVSRTAVTALAARVAEKAGVTLIGYARGGKMVVYTCPDRVLIKEAEV